MRLKNAHVSGEWWELFERQDDTDTEDNEKNRRAGRHGSGHGQRKSSAVRSAGEMQQEHSVRGPFS